MRLTKHRRVTRADMNMTPMIDIVFLLIIFFMTVSQVHCVPVDHLLHDRVSGFRDQ
jgi:biopolymer transport protein ExbD